jgi:sulfoxide reductase heme-binding subunit YedZ
MSNAPRQAAVSWAKAALFVACLGPLAALIAAGVRDELGANPVETVTRMTGDWTLRLLLTTLLVTPLRRVTGWNALVRLRRMLGLFAFFYVCLHVLTYAVLDASLDPAYIVEDILERPYITVGFASFCALVPLAVTSTDRMVRRLGGRRWRQLHRLAYLAAFGGTVHFLWLVKADVTEPLAYMGALGVLMLARVPRVASGLGRLRMRPAPNRGGGTADLSGGASPARGP